MTIINQLTDQKLRQGLKYLNRVILWKWRLGLGPYINAWPEGSGRIMVLTHTGRKSGLRRQTPVNYAVVDDELYCTSGFGKSSDWYRNVMAEPKVEVWLPEGWWAGRVEEVTDAKSRLPLLREVLIASGYAARAVGIDPIAMSDEALEKATSEYRLLHIRRTAERTGPGGPGDLAWVWPLATMILLPMVLFRPRRRRRWF